MPERLATRGGLRVKVWHINAVVFGALVFLILVGVAPFTGPGTAADAAAGDAVRQVAFIGTLGFALLGYFLAGRHAQAHPVPISGCVLLGWCVVSSLWSIDPSISLRRSGLLAVVTIAAFLCTSALGQVRTIKVLKAVLIGVLIGDWIAAVLTPDIVDWRGLQDHKNEAGAVMAIAGLVFIFSYFHDRRFRDLIWAGAAVTFLFFTHSKASIGFFIVCISAGVIYQFSGRHQLLRRLLVAAVGLLLIGGLSAVLLNIDWIAGFLSDNPNLLTGRAGLWRFVLELIAERPLLGYGYGWVWASSTDLSIGPVIQLGWPAAHSHNGYLEITVDTGVIGALMALVILIVRPLLAFARPDAERLPHAALLFSWLVFAILHNLLEADLLVPDRSVWLMHLVVIASVSRLSRPQPSTQIVQNPASVDQ